MLIYGLVTWMMGIAYCSSSPPYPFYATDYDKKFGSLHADDLEIAREQARELFYFGYRNYLKHAFPLDELDPIHCRGRGHDHKNVNNFNVNDALGDFSLTLIDSLNTLVVLGDRSEFHKAVNLILNNVSFERNVTVQVFETTIRVIGALLSSHLILTNENPYHGNFSLDGYEGGLLRMARELAVRLLPAFYGTKTGIPFTRVNLQRGVLPGTTNETCTAGAGSLILEFGVLSRLLGDETFENLARGVSKILWTMRNKDTGLLGNVVNIQSGKWAGILSGVGAGIDSFYEYLLKTYILFGERVDLEMFENARLQIRRHLRRGRPKCRYGSGDPPFYANVNMHDGTILNTWVDALQASFSGVLTLAGDVDEAICLHAFYYALWQKYDLLPERFNWHFKTPDVLFYPLRPEFVESTYLLYLATKNPFYQHVGLQIIDSLNLHARVNCGFATVHNVHDKSLEDRMESFFLSETCKYLYLLFDTKNPVNRNYDRLIFSTEGHTFPITAQFRRRRVSRPTTTNGDNNKHDDEGDSSSTTSQLDNSSSLSSLRISSTSSSQLFVSIFSNENNFSIENDNDVKDEFQLLNENRSFLRRNSHEKSDRLYRNSSVCAGDDCSELRWRPPLDEWRLGQYFVLVGMSPNL